MFVWFNSTFHPGVMYASLCCAKALCFDQVAVKFASKAFGFGIIYTTSYYCVSLNSFIKQ